MTTLKNIVSAWEYEANLIIENAIDNGIINEETIQIACERGNPRRWQAWDEVFEVLAQNGVPSVLAAAFASCKTVDEIVRELEEDEMDREAVLDAGMPA